MRYTYILLKLIAKQFYIQNSGIFLLFLFFGLGFLSGKEHIALASSIAQSPALLFYIIICWSAYLWASVRFVQEAIASKENLWVRNIIFFKAKQQWIMLIITQIVLNAPIIAYAGFISIFIAKYNQWSNLAMLTTYIVLSNLLPIVFYRKRLAAPIGDNKSSRLKVRANRLIATPVWLWSLNSLLHNRSFLYLITKTLSIGVLIAFTTIDNASVYDWRWLSIGVILVSMINITLITELFNFFKRDVPWMMNMPLSGLERTFIQWNSLLLLILPEGFVFIKYFPKDRPLGLFVELTIFALSICLSLFASFSVLSPEADNNLKKYFFFAIILFLLCLFGIPPTLSAFLLFSFTLTVHVSHYKINLE
ncbi:hypothetical protein JMN32_16810 [Fulvivirga sp. 29W222]|uniref:Uncharacterized protein n=1 Tax=Fulvivirga marina TaxID=2494733 RepID=A0A937KF82_9BACT|nr:hypothetical protein [Fulvivirga marina]MBL6447980.1 hypothetical protein [Fulvivirga marina]